MGFWKRKSSTLGLYCWEHPNGRCSKPWKGDVDSLRLMGKIGPFVAGRPVCHHCQLSKSLFYVFNIWISKYTYTCICIYIYMSFVYTMRSYTLCIACAEQWSWLFPLKIGSNYLKNEYGNFGVFRQAHRMGFPRLFSHLLVHLPCEYPSPHLSIASSRSSYALRWRRRNSSPVSDGRTGGWRNPSPLWLRKYGFSDSKRCFNNQEFGIYTAKNEDWTVKFGSTLFNNSQRQSHMAKGQVTGAPLRSSSRIRSSMVSSHPFWGAESDSHP